MKSKNNIPIVLCCLVVCLCFSLQFFKSEQLTKIPQEEALRRILNGEKQNFQFAAYMNPEGQPLTKDERQLLNTGELTRHYYENRHKQVKQVRCFPKTDEENLYEKRLTKLLNINPFKNRELVTIDCLDNNLEKLYERLSPNASTPKQNNIEEGATKEIDDVTLVISVIEQCGFPFSTNTVRAVWEVIINAEKTGLAEYYYQSFKEAYENNLLPITLMNNLKNKIGKRKTSVAFDQEKMKEVFGDSGINFDSLNTRSLDQELTDKLIVQANKLAAHE